MSRLCDWATPLVAFLLYTNAAVVAVHFHGVPFVLAAAYPLLLLLPIARDVVFRGEPLNVTPALTWVFALMLVVFIGAIFAIRPETSFDSFTEFVLEGMLVYLLVSLAIRTPEDLQRVIWALIAAGAFMGSLVAMQQFSGNPENEFGGFAQLDLNGRGFQVSDFGGTDAQRQRRLGGPLGMPNRFAQIMAVLVPLAWFQFLASRRMAAKLAALGALLLILIGCALAFSRGAAVGLALMGLVMMAMGYVRVRQVAAVGVAVLLLALLVPQYGRRLASLGEVASLATDGGAVGMANADGSVQGRLTEMVTAVLVFADHPVLGVGPRMYREHYIDYARVAGGRVRQGPRQAHNMALHVAAEHGLLGLAALGMALFVTFRQLERARRRWYGVRPDMALLTAGLTLALVTYLTVGLFLHLTYIRYFWFILAVVAAGGQLAPRADPSLVSQILKMVSQQSRA